MNEGNVDTATVEGFGDEWSAFDQTALSESERDDLFHRYFSIFPLEELSNATGFDLGCGPGRWATVVAPRVGTLHVIDPASKALAVARRALSGHANVHFHHAGVDDIPLPDASQDFGYSLGVLHHIPDTQAALRACVRKLRLGAPFLLYLYYSFDNRAGWFRALWTVSDLGRSLICRLPFPIRKAVSSAIAATVYFPTARLARVAERLGADIESFPLSAYRSNSFYTMRTDALDRFGTRLEQRFSRAQIEAMMRNAGLDEIKFSESAPYWVATGRKRFDTALGERQV